MKTKSLSQALKPVFALFMVISLLLPANPTLALPQSSAPLAALTPPDDPQYVNQWHYKEHVLETDPWGINLFKAWGITTGSPQTVVAVLDTGVTYHEDLSEDRFYPGYDFVSDATKDNDDNTGGNAKGRDGNAYDPGDYGACGPSTWQGTHVAGIIGAISGNATGVAGMNWSTMMLPVRVIGSCGSVTVTDLVDGMLWAAAVPQPSPNSNPADVIHVSASIPGQSCVDYQDEIDSILATGAVIVAAAGDTGSTGASASNNFPGNCEGVITVSATDSEGVRASYSNYGPAVYISAPGGGDNHGDVLSTSNIGGATPSGNGIYGEMKGTAMAAAQVSGAVSLMFAANRYITRQQVTDILKNTAGDFSGGLCVPDPARPENNQCGWGILDAGEAVRVANLPDLVITNVTLDPPNPGPNELFNVKITVKNRGGSTGNSGYVYRNVYVGTELLDRNPMNLWTEPNGCLLTADPDDEPNETDKGDYFKDDYNNSIPAGASETLPVEIKNRDTLEVGLPSGNYKIYTYTDAQCIFNESDEKNNNYPPIIVSIGNIPDGFEKSSPPNTTGTPLSPDVTLDWTETLGVSRYEYCVDTTNDQSCDDDNWISTGLDSSVELFDLSSDTVYYWQARAKNQYGYRYANDPDPDDEMIEGWWAFKTKPFPSLISPAHKSLVTTLTPTLIAKPMAGAVSYDFEVSENPGFSPARFTASNIVNPSYLLTAGQALPYGTYYWRARAKFANTTYSEWSAVNQFGVTFQISPAHNAYLTLVKPTFTWKAITNARKYNLEISRASDFSVLEFPSVETTAASYAAPANMDYGTHYWRLRVCTGASVSVCSDPANWSKFAIGSKFVLTPPLSAKPVQVSPAASAMVSKENLILSWNKVTDDDRYEVQVDNQSSFASPEVTHLTRMGITSHTVTTPLLDGVYYWRVRASNYLTAPGPWSASRSFTLDTLPLTLAPVLNLPAHNASLSGTPAFSWKAVTGAKKYQFQLDDDDDFGSPIIYSPDVTTLTYTPKTPLPVNTLLYWRVVAKDAAGNAGPWSLVRSITISPPLPAVPVLTYPANAASISDSTPDLTWNAVPYATTYELKLDEVSTFASPEVHSVSSPNYLRTVALNDGTYYWLVRGKNANGKYGSWSSTRSFKVDTIAPDAPVLNLPANNTPVSATPAFSWKSSTTGAVKYQLQYGTNSGLTVGVYTSAVLTTLNHTPKPAMVPGTYHWRVKGWDAAGNESAWSEVRKVTILAAPALVSPASGFITDNTTPSFTWKSAPSGNVYDIEIATNSGFIPASIARSVTIPIGVFTYTVSPALPSGLYYWRVRARTIYSEPGVWSSYRTLTVDRIPPLPPTLSSPANNADFSGNPVFKWLVPATATRYQLQYAGDENFTVGVVTSAELTTASYTPNPPLAVGSYYWRVKARDGFANWSDYGGAWKVNVLPTIPLAPGLVSPLNAAVTNDPTPEFKWNQTVSGNTYDIEIASDAGFLNIIPTLPNPKELTGTTYMLTGSLPSDGMYYWRVRAWNAAVPPVLGAWSAARSFTVDTLGPAAPVLSSPVNPATVTGTPIFKWAGSAGAVRYRFEYDVSPDFNSVIGASSHYISGEISALTFTPPTVPAGIYYWRVQAKDAAGNWGAQTVTPFVVTIVQPVPAAPGLSSPANSLVTSNNAVPEFNWNAIPYAATYDFELDIVSTFATKESHSVSSPTYTRGGTLLDATYYWRVRGVNNAAEGAWSVVRSFRVDTQAPAPPELSLPGVDASVTGTPTFSWKTSVGATKYQFQYDEDAGFGSPYTSAVLTTASHKPPTMSLGTYYWRVIAGDAANNWSAWNSSTVRAVTVTPVSPSGIPALVGPVNGSILLDTTPTVSWKAVTGAVKYHVQMDGNSTFSSPEFDVETASLNATSTPLSKNGVYYWRVRKVDVYGGKGAWSAVWRFSVNEVIPLAVTSSSLSALSAPVSTGTPTLNWNSVANASVYQLQVDDDADFNSPSYDETAAGTSRLISTPLADGRYYWRVRAINQYGTPGPWSGAWVISIAVPPVP